MGHALVRTRGRRPTHAVRKVQRELRAIGLPRATSPDLFEFCAGEHSSEKALDPQGSLAGGECGWENERGCLCTCTPENSQCVHSPASTPSRLRSRCLCRGEGSGRLHRQQSFVGVTPREQANWSRGLRPTRLLPLSGPVPAIAVVVAPCTRIEALFGRLGNV